MPLQQEKLGGLQCRMLAFGTPGQVQNQVVPSGMTTGADQAPVLARLDQHLVRSHVEGTDGAGRQSGVRTIDTGHPRSARGGGLPAPAVPSVIGRRPFLATALDLPTFNYEQVRLLKRCTLIAVAGIIEHVFYPVFPPDRNAEQVIEWLATAHRE